MKRKRKLSKSQVWPSVNCLHEQLLVLLQAKKAFEKAKVALRKAKNILYEAMKEYEDVMGSECSHQNEFFTLWEFENGMCCPKVCFTCCGSEADGECDDGTNTPDDSD